MQRRESKHGLNISLFFIFFYTTTCVTFYLYNTMNGFQGELSPFILLLHASHQSFWWQALCPTIQSTFALKSVWIRCCTNWLISNIFRTLLFVILSQSHLAFRGFEFTVAYQCNRDESNFVHAIQRIEKNYIQTNSTATYLNKKPSWVHYSLELLDVLPKKQSPWKMLTLCYIQSNGCLWR